MDQYQISFLALSALSGLMFLAQPKQGNPQAPSKSTTSKIQNVKNPLRDYYIVYVLAMGADWLQGPYLYSLYTDTHGLSSRLVSFLFTTGFVAGAASAPLIGSLADRHGRKKACIVYCVSYALSCLLTIIPAVPLLFLGRVLGGVSTSLLFSVFDSWLVSDFSEKRLEEKGCDLSSTYGVLSTLNSGTAIVSGVVSEAIVAGTRSRKAPFLLSVVLLCGALQRIRTSWTENYGSSTTSSGPSKTGNTSLWDALKQPPVLSLILATTMFEGSMYLFVFFWAPALQAGQANPTIQLPYGLIFACFMTSVTAASLFFNLATKWSRVTYTSLLLSLLSISALVFLRLSKSTHMPEETAFALFCIFEACVGLYFPCVGYLKGRLIEDGVRAKVYAFMRIPLNVFVVASLVLMRESGDFQGVFGVCAGCLGLAIVVVGGTAVTAGMP